MRMQSCTDFFWILPLDQTATDFSRGLAWQNRFEPLARVAAADPVNFSGWARPNMFKRAVSCFARWQPQADLAKKAVMRKVEALPLR